MNEKNNPDSKYLIILKPLKKKGKYKEELRYNFETRNPRPKFDNLMNLPQMYFNTPNWMPVFHTPYEKYHLEKGSELYQENFRKRLERGKEPELKLLLHPRPPRASNCSICSVNFEDYFNHISSNEHIENFKNSNSMKEAFDEIKHVQQKYYKKKLEEAETKRIEPKDDSAYKINILLDNIAKSVDKPDILAKKNSSKLKDTHNKIRRMTIQNSNWNPYFPSSAPYDNSKADNLINKGLKPESLNSPIKISNYQQRYPLQFISPKAVPVLSYDKSKTDRQFIQITQSKSKSKRKKTISQRNLDSEFELEKPSKKAKRMSEIKTTQSLTNTKSEILNSLTKSKWDSLKSKVTEWVSEFKQKISDLVKS